MELKKTSVRPRYCRLNAYRNASFSCVPAKCTLRIDRLRGSDAGFSVSTVCWEEEAEEEEESPVTTISGFPRFPSWRIQVRSCRVCGELVWTWSVAEKKRAWDRSSADYFFSYKNTRVFWNDHRGSQTFHDRFHFRIGSRCDLLTKIRANFVPVYRLRPTR